MNEKPAWRIFANVVASTPRTRAIELRGAIGFGQGMFRPAELADRIRRLVHGRPPVIIPALDSTFDAHNPELPLSPRSSRWAKSVTAGGKQRWLAVSA